MLYVFQLAGNVSIFTDMKVMWDVLLISANRKYDMTMYIYCHKGNVGCRMYQGCQSAKLLAPKK